jgi:hypothetical protein
MSFILFMKPYPNIAKKNLVLQRKYPKLCIISLYIMYLTTFYIKNIFNFPKKNNFMLVAPRKHFPRIN